jgi:hypothetical protein
MNATLTADEAELLALFRQIGPTKRDALLKFVRTMPRAIVVVTDAQGGEKKPDVAS